MGNLFGTQKKKTRITEQDKAILVSAVFDHHFPKIII